MENLQNNHVGLVDEQSLIRPGPISQVLKSINKTNVVNQKNIEKQYNNRNKTYWARNLLARASHGHKNTRRQLNNEETYIKKVR